MYCTSTSTCNTHFISRKSSSSLSLSLSLQIPCSFWPFFGLSQIVITSPVLLSPTNLPTNHLTKQVKSPDLVNIVSHFSLTPLYQLEGRKDGRKNGGGEGVGGLGWVEHFEAKAEYCVMNPVCRLGAER